MSSLMNFNDHVFVTKASHLDGGIRLWSGMERVGRRHATLSPRHTTLNDKHNENHTGSADARVNKGRAYRFRSGRRWKVYY